MLGLLVPELCNPVFPAFAEALETRAARRGYSSVLCNTRSASMREEEYVRMLLARGIEGMVFVSPESTDAAASHDHYRQLKDEGVHMVFVNGGMPSLDVPNVGVDEQSAGYLATRHLVELGHRADRLRQRAELVDAGAAEGGRLGGGAGGGRVLARPGADRARAVRRGGRGDGDGPACWRRSGRPR